MDIDAPGPSSFAPSPSRTSHTRRASHDMDTDPFEDTGNIESQFYAQGYDAGFAHGRQHGLFEGRQLGQEKAWEVWEEVGFYEGYARFWAGAGRGAHEPAGRKEAKAQNHARTLLGLIQTFPTYNPTPSPTPAPHYGSQIGPDSPRTSPAEPERAARADSAADEPDLALLLASIRARYRLLCTSLGTRPRLVAAPSAVEQGAVEGVDGPIKGVDTRLLRY
ncbi:hypothetical protein Q5752_004244 [Cryptotrichosporon argae]